MIKDELNRLLRSYVKENLSPNKSDIAFVSKIYQSFCELLGNQNCLQIGSYPRYTSVRPIHDLDVLYIMGNWHQTNILPFKDLTTLAEKFGREYKNPTGHNIKIQVQTHSITFQFVSNDSEIFAVDLVPALRDTINEFGKYTFYVPEVIKLRRGDKRKMFYKQHLAQPQEIEWIKTDPLGYIQIASEINEQNSDFRKAVKFVKGWKYYCKSIDDEFSLKSFHIEQIITEMCKEIMTFDAFDLIFYFFLPLQKRFNPRQ
ncbi:hypothetical protein LZD49_15725 [Dyadobacter sp. CY261]|uniref:hypothetical protein n=1 Tax=Dyadobacter sp. CY261 TaxID=2907203 RepID=UPI001F267A6F|nr:hypothetical protein [Dyadobacter sp. CY261]MCF0071927.1 hypothetical protein [Dyadobacter sp. CY261]